MNIKTLLRSIFSKNKKDVADERKARILADNNKVDKIEGKGLSTNDFTNLYKDQVDANTTAINNIKDGANIDSFSDTEAALNLKVDKSQIGYFEWSSGNLTDAQYTEALKKYCMLFNKINNNSSGIYYKTQETNAIIIFDSIHYVTDVPAAEKDTMYTYSIMITKSDKSVTQQMRIRYLYSSDKTDELLNAKQPTLVSGTNIKTINGESVLGSGDLETGVNIVGGFSSNWSEKTWSGLTSIYGKSIWTCGSNIYYSRSSDQYVLDKSTSTWSEKTWSGLTSFIGQSV